MQCHAPLLEELVKYFPQPSYVLRTLEQGQVVCVLRSFLAWSKTWVGRVGEPSTCWFRAQAWAVWRLISRGWVRIVSCSGRGCVLVSVIG